MGRLQAEEMAGCMSLDQALTWHLRHNHYPPLPIALLEPCKKAIERAQEAIILDDEKIWEELVDLPEGLNDRETGKPQMTVGKLFRACHLDGFVTVDDEEPEDADDD